MMTASKPTGPVCLITALAQECAVVRKCLGPDCDAFVLVQSGMGRAAGYIAAEELGRTRGMLAGLVSLGFCGALAPGLRSGSVMVPQYILTDDREERFDPDAGWREATLARLAAMQPHGNALFSARDVITSTAGKQAIHVERKAAAVDMESAGIAHAARRLGVPFLAIRIVLDEAGDALPRATANAIHADGNLNARGLVSGLVRHPKDIPALMALGRKSSRAQKQLKAVCEALGPDFSIPA